MQATTTSIVRSRTDDYLDLYNYARQLGDIEWQQQILHTLQDRSLADKEISYFILQDLWNKFDTVNQKLIRLYEQLKEITDKSQAEQLREQVWELKLQRVAITRKIYANC